jgi:hypothetical protein
MTTLVLLGDLIMLESLTPIVNAPLLWQCPLDHGLITYHLISSVNVRLLLCFGTMEWFFLQ